jgi:hypothetical protein
VGVSTFRDRNHLPLIGGWESGVQVVHSHDSGPVGNVEHCGQNQWAQRQPHGPLQSFPPTIAPRGTTEMPGGLQKIGRTPASALEPKQRTAAVARAAPSSREPRIVLVISLPSGRQSTEEARSGPCTFLVELAAIALFDYLVGLLDGDVGGLGLLNDHAAKRGEVFLVEAVIIVPEL